MNTYCNGDDNTSDFYPISFLTITVSEPVLKLWLSKVKSRCRTPKLPANFLVPLSVEAFFRLNVYTYLSGIPDQIYLVF